MGVGCVEGRDDGRCREKGTHLRSKKTKLLSILSKDNLHFCPVSPPGALSRPISQYFNKQILHTSLSSSYASTPLVVLPMPLSLSLFLYIYNSTSLLDI